MKCVIFGAGMRCDRSKIPAIAKEDLVIAADGGYDWLMELGIAPAVVLGDFDSTALKPPKEAIVHPVRKDDTDMGLAVQEGEARGYREFWIFGGTGNRADHTMANYQLLTRLARAGRRGYLIDDWGTATVLHNESIGFAPIDGGTLSVFSLSDCSNEVDILGFSYELKHGRLTNDYGLGVSNEFAGREGLIRVGSGTLLVLGNFMPDCLREAEERTEGRSI